MIRRRITILGFVATIVAGATFACGLVAQDSVERHEIRRAALAYDRAVNGPTEEVIIFAQRGELRSTLGVTSETKTVWVFSSFALQEYLRQLPAETSYVLLQGIDFQGEGIASIAVARRNASGLNQYTLTLSRSPAGWLVP